jgi:GNAT superfamily N-acetyltransferase/VanZ family protein
MQVGYRLRAAEQRDLVALPGIERRAAALYVDHGVPASVLEATRTPAELASGLAGGGLWVAADAQDRAVGFALAIEHAHGVHLEEVDVDPEHGRRGIGTALVEHVCETARRRGHQHVTLIAFADVPWNAPFYERLGFRVLGGSELPEAVRGILDDEARLGLDPARRVAMRRRVDPRGRALRGMTGVWLLAIVALSAIASVRPQLLLQWTPYLPGRDKTGHFLLMGGFAGIAVLAFAGRRFRDRRIPALLVLVAVTLIVVLEEGVQHWLPMRNFSMVDLASSLAGVLCFGALAAVWRSLCGGSKSRAASRRRAKTSS